MVARSRRSSDIRRGRATPTSTRSGRSRSTYPSGASTAAPTTIVPISQSRDYVAAATAAGARAELVEVDGDHFVVIDPSSDAWARQLALLDDLA